MFAEHRCLLRDGSAQHAVWSFVIFARRYVIRLVFIILLQPTHNLFSHKVGSPSKGCCSHILLPVSWFKEEELINAISEMKKILEWYIFPSSSGIIFILTFIHLVDL